MYKMFITATLVAALNSVLSLVAVEKNRMSSYSFTGEAVQFYISVFSFLCETFRGLVLRYLEYSF